MIARFQCFWQTFFIYFWLPIRCQSNPPLGVGSADSIHSQLNQYMAELQEPLPSDVQPLVFWQQRRSVYNKVAPVLLQKTSSPHLLKFPGLRRENIFTVWHAVVREMQPHAHFAWDEVVSKAEQQSSDWIQFSVELETAIWTVSYWLLKLPIHSSAFICFWWFE